METIIFSSTRNITPRVTFSPLKSKSRPISRNNNVTVTSALSRSGSNGSSQYKGRLVDENMIVLRKRIHEMKMIERNYEPPSEWMHWEKQVYGEYDEYICMVLGLVQAQLINTRPGVALAALALLTLSVPTSVILLATHFFENAHKTLL